jgi:hypothetical protein
VFGFFKRARALERKAEAYVAGLLREPSADDVAWLAKTATKGDEDHARWELRYACRSIGQIVAQRDALDDRTASIVAQALTAAFESDKNIDRDRFSLVEQQFNARLSAYRDAIGARGTDTSTRLGQTLLAFSGGSFRDVDDNVRRAADIVAGFERDANEALRSVFGSAALPEHMPPSAVVGAPSK